MVFKIAVLTTEFSRDVFMSEFPNLIDDDTCVELKAEKSAYEWLDQIRERKDHFRLIIAKYFYPLDAKETLLVLSTIVRERDFCRIFPPMNILQVSLMKTYLSQFVHFMPRTIFSPTVMEAFRFLRENGRLIYRPIDDMERTNTVKVNCAEELYSLRLQDGLIQQYQEDVKKSDEFKCVIINDQPMYRYHLKVNVGSKYRYEEMCDLIESIISFSDMEYDEQVFVKSVNDLWIRLYGPTPYLRIDFTRRGNDRKIYLVGIEASDVILFYHLIQEPIRSNIRETLKAFM